MGFGWGLELWGTGYGLLSWEVRRPSLGLRAELMLSEICWNIGWHKMALVYD